MKLCQKCVDAISKLVEAQDSWFRDDMNEVVPEAKCEFPAHKDYNSLVEQIVEGARPYA